jgi:hypothetical protein
VILLAIIERDCCLAYCEYDYSSQKLFTLCLIFVTWHISWVFYYRYYQFAQRWLNNWHVSRTWLMHFENSLLVSQTKFDYYINIRQVLDHCISQAKRMLKINSFTEN